MPKKADFLSWIRENWILLFLVLQPLLDVLAFWTQSESGTIAGLIRLAMLAGLVLYVLLKKRSAGFFAAMGITALVFLLHVANGFRVGYISLAADLSYIARVVSLPVTAICFCCCFDGSEQCEQTVKGIWICAGLVTAVVALSAVTNTYTHTYIIEKIGISGWVIDSNRSCHSDILSTLAVFSALLAFRTEKPWLRYTLPPLLFVLMITNATTACYLTLLAVTAGFPVFVIFRSFLLKEKLNNGKRILLAEMAVLFALSIVIYPVTPRAEMEALEKQGKSDKEARFVQEMADLGYDIYSLSLEEKLSDPVVHEHLTEYYNGFIASTVNNLRVRYDVDRTIIALNGTVNGEILGDTRNMKRLNAQFIFEDSDLLTRFTGFEIAALGNTEDDLENDWYAVYYYYGYIGIALYIAVALLVLGRVVLLLIKDFKGSMTNLNFTLLMSFVLMLGLCHFSGAMLRRPNASIYLAAVIALIWYQTGRTAKEGGVGCA